MKLRLIIQKLHSPLLVIVAIGVFCLGLIAIAKHWDGLSAIAYYLLGIVGLPPAIVAGFPSAAHHVRRMVQAALLVTGIAVLVFVSSFGWSFVHQPVYKIGVSLPFGKDWHVSTILYNAIHDGFRDQGARFLNPSQTRMSLYGKLFELVPFDDSKIGDTSCVTIKACEVRVYSDDTATAPIGWGGFNTKAYFSDLVNDPHLVGIIGPYNSGVALREIPAINDAHVPLISPANTADCLTDPNAAKGDCDAKQLDQGYYFRIATPDSLRQKVLADYLWDHWQDCVPNTACLDPTTAAPKVVVFRESGPQATTFSAGAAEAFAAAWTQHTAPEPTIYPIADASSDDDLVKSINRLTFSPNIVIYAGTGTLGGRLYATLNRQGYEHVVFAGAGSLRDTYRTDDQTAVNPLYVADYATITASKEIANTIGAKYSSIYAACAYDATGMLLQSILATQKDDRQFTNYRLSSSVDGAASPIQWSMASGFRQVVAHKLHWINTSGNVIYHGLTGTYSFDDSDTHGAAGVTISVHTASPNGGSWMAVN